MFWDIQEQSNLLESLQIDLGASLQDQDALRKINKNRVIN